MAALSIDVLQPLLIAHPVECEVSFCNHQHERVVDLTNYSSDTLIHLCRKHYEDFVATARTLP